MLFKFDGETINSNHITRMWIKFIDNFSWELNIKMVDKATLQEEFFHESEAEERLNQIKNDINSFNKPKPPLCPNPT